MKSKKYNSEEDFISKWEPYFQKVADLQNLLFSQSPDCDVNEFIPLIPDFFFQSKIQLIQLFSSICSLHFTRTNHRDFCSKLIETLLPRFLLFISKAELASMFEFQSKDLYLRFFELGIITVDEILEKLKLFQDEEYFLYFHDIIEEQSKSDFDILKNKYQKALNDNDLRDFKIRRKIGKNDTPIALSIREDDVDKCQTIMSSSNIGFNSRIPYSLYETLGTVNRKSNMPYLLEYAAFFGSIKCFKYFIMNNAPITEHLVSFAIFGGNVEIIHICENCHASLKLALRSSICCFRDDFYDYFQDAQDIEFTDSAVCCAIRNYNANAIIRCLRIIYKNPNICDDRGDYPILISSVKGYIDILFMLSSIKSIDFNVVDQNGDTSIALSADHHHILIFNILIEVKEVDVNNINSFGENLLVKLVEDNLIGLLQNTLNRNDIIVMNPNCHENEIYKAISFGNMDAIKLFFNHKKYKYEVTQINSLAFFIIVAAFNEMWNFVDYFLSKCQQLLNLRKIIDLFFEQNAGHEDINKALQEKIQKVANIDDDN